MMPPVSNNTALLLDIDGTLLDLARTPDSVKVPRELVRALENLAQRLSGALAFVSGRSLDSIDRLFAPFTTTLVEIRLDRDALPFDLEKISNLLGWNDQPPAAPG